MWRSAVLTEFPSARGDLLGLKAAAEQAYDLRLTLAQRRRALGPRGSLGSSRPSSCTGVDRRRPRRPSPSSRARLSESVVQAIRWRATREPLVFVLEDLHLADIASVALLGHTSARGSPVREFCRSLRIARRAATSSSPCSTPSTPVRPSAYGHPPLPSGAMRASPTADGRLSQRTTSDGPPRPEPTLASMGIQHCGRLASGRRASVPTTRIAKADDTGKPPASPQP